MSAAALPGRRGPEAARWVGSLAVVLGLHAGAAAFLLRHVPLMELPAEPEAVMLELPPVPVPVPEPAPEKPPEPESAPPAPPPPEPSPPPPPEPPLPVPEPAVALPEPPPPPKPPPRPSPPRPRPQAARPVPRVAEAPLPSPYVPSPPAPAAAPAPSPDPSPLSNAVPTWLSQLVAKLQRAKRYPDQARSRGDQGTASVTFTMDRAGRVLSATLARSSGSLSLDEEAVAMVHRAEPLPALPPEIPGATLTRTIPINFTLR